MSMTVDPAGTTEPLSSISGSAPERSTPRVIGMNRRPATLLDLLLNEQHELSAVERFELDHVADAVPAQARYYSALLPAAPPGPGQQYAFDVDLDRCSGCKACVTACHSLNGLDDNETWRDVGLLAGGSLTQPLVQHVTTACHHCLEPACMEACPVNAYEKDAVTGIVKHLDDQCFGCQYCTLACPYDVPKYSASKGIVRKCDMCSDRLLNGEAPACVQSCPHQAISIRVVDRQQVLEDSEATSFLPAAPDSQLTYPTTTYRTKRVLPRNLLPVDYYSVSMQHPHWPLIVMLVLTQLSVGAFLAGQIVSECGTPEIAASIGPLHSLTALVMGLLALGASTLHLGRPQYAFRAVLGLRHSWLSREIVGFGIFAGLAVVDAAGNWFQSSLPFWSPQLQNMAGRGVALTGAIGVFCSVMIYAVTGRPLWSLSATLLRFALTTVLLGTAALWLTIVVLAAAGNEGSRLLTAQHQRSFALVILSAGVWKLLAEASLFQHLLSRQVTPLKRSALLMLRPLLRVTFLRFMAGLLGGVLLPCSLLQVAQEKAGPETPSVLLASGVLMLVFLLLGELAERYLFFAAVAAPRMPGNLR